MADRRDRRWLPFVIAAVLLTASTASAATIYVDSRFGDDRLDGLTAERVSDLSGPVRTLRRGILLLSTGDQLVLANNGLPYEGGAALVGRRQSGTPILPLEIIGNGAVLSGAKPIEPSTWQRVREDLWRITPLRKGWYQLVLNGAAVPEVPCPPGAVEVPPLPEGSWTACGGAIYFRPVFGTIPAELPLQLADEQTGLTILNVDHVVIRDLTFQHFRQDGVHLHDRCSNIVLENVTCVENGRAGMVVAGTSHALLRNVSLARNRKASLLVEGLGIADAEGGDFDVEPTVHTLPRSAAR